MRPIVMKSVALWLVLAGCGGASETPAPAPAPAPEPAAEPAPEAPSTARVFFVEPEEGAVVTSPVHVVMGVEGMEVHKAGEVMPGTGHHHIIVNGPIVPEGEVVPSDEKHIHFGAGQTETDLELAPGEYTLRLQFADGMHQSYGKDLSAARSITVVEGGEAAAGE